MLNTKRITDVMDRYIDSEAETGAAAVVTKGGKNIFEYSCGLADVENNKPFELNTICRAFSCSKIVTGTAAMQLLERGLIDLENPLEWYIPEFANAVYVRDGKKIAVSRPVKLRDLLNMTSGIAYPGDPHEGTQPTSELWGELDQSYKDGKQMTTMEFAKKAGNCPLMHDIGKEWQYGSSADIFGAVVESVTGMKYSKYLEENIFSPLGMNDTAFYVPPEKNDRLAVFYEGAGKDRRKLGWVNLSIYDYDHEPAFCSGGAGLFSTAQDYAKLGAALSSGSSQILGRKTIDFMRRNALSDEQKLSYSWDSCKGYGYANFVRTLQDPNAASTLASVGSFGWDGWSGTYLLIDPDEKLSITLFIQRAGAGTTSLSRSLVNAVYSTL